MNNKTFNHLFYLHRWLGTLIVMILFVVFLSGTVTIFRDEIRIWSQHVATAPLPATAINEQRVSLDQLLESIEKVQPLSSMKRSLLRLPDADSKYFELLYNLPGSNTVYRKQFDASNGTYQGDIESQLTDFIFQLHAYFTAKNKIARYLVGFSGLLLLLMLVSGFLIHKVTLKAFYTLRSHRGKRVLFQDLHKLLGLWTLLFLLMIAYTGTVLGLKDWLILPMGYIYYDGNEQQARQAFVTAGKTPKASGEKAEMISIDSIIEQALQQVPGFNPGILNFKNWQDTQAEVRIAGSLPNTLLPKSDAVSMRYSAVTGELLGIDHGLERSPVRRIYDAISPLHYGDFFGIWLKVAYAVFSILAMVVLISGMELWLLRRKRLS